MFNDKALPKPFIKQTHNTGIWEAKDNQGNILYTAIKNRDNPLNFSIALPINDEDDYKCIA